MADFGLTEQGLVPMTLNDIREFINTRVLRILPTLDVTEQSYEGQLIGIISEAISRCWEALVQVFTSIDPDAATGAALQMVCALTGTTMPLPTASAVNLTLTGADTTVVPAASQSRTADGATFAHEESGTLAALDAWTITTAYIVGDRVTNGGNAYQCTIAGTSAGSGGPVGVDPLVTETDGSVTWRYLGEGVAAVDVLAAATDVGPTIGNSGTVTEIVTPVFGWTGVVNVLDASVGRSLLTNAQLRALRNIELSQPGTSPLDAIGAALLGVTNVTAVSMFENVSDTTVDGMPAHSVEAMVTGGDDQAIWDTLRKNVAGGIKTHGDEIGTSTDSQGTEHVMAFTRPTEILVYTTLEILVDPDVFPADGATQIEDAIVAWGDVQKTGKNVTTSAIIARAMAIDGVLEVTEVLISAFPVTTPVASTTIQIGPRELAVYDTSRISITATDGVA